MRKLAIGFACANCGQTVDPNEIALALSESDSDWEVYRLAPAPPGLAQAAAIDFWVLVSSVSAIVTLVDAAIKTWRKVVKSGRADTQDGRFLYVVYQCADGSNVDLKIRADSSCHEVEFQEFVSNVTKTEETEDDDGNTSKIIREIHETDLWIRVR